LKTIKATRYHDFSMGHRVVGHENKCAFLHGHNYRVTFHCESNALDDVGRVIDFSVIKSTLCQWLEDNWDHKFLAWIEDPVMRNIMSGIKQNNMSEEDELFIDSVVYVKFNPTAENIAMYLVEEIAPKLLHNTGVVLSKVVVSETRKCSAEYTL